MRKELMFASILMFMVPGCAPFVSGVASVSSNDDGCDALIPPEWEKGVESADPPAGDSVGDWVAFGDAQTGRLDVANDRTRDTIGIVRRCEERDRKDQKRARRGFFGRLLGL